MARTADAIGRDIAAVTESLDRLHAELAECQPSTLVVNNVIRTGNVEFVRRDNQSFEINASADIGPEIRTIIWSENVPKIRAWFAYHYPEVSS